MRAGFLFQPPKSEAESLRIFFDRFGGYTAFVKKSLEIQGYKPLQSLKEVAKKTAAANKQDYEDIGEGTLADGIE